MNEYVLVASFAVFLLGFMLIGALSARWSKKTSEDYLVASRSVNPWLAALSAVASNNSGYMFIGLIGFTYREGIGAIWLQIGWILGDAISWSWVHRRVRSRSEAIGATSVAGLLATDDSGKVSRPISVAAGVLTLLFLGAYAAAQLMAGSTTLHTLFEWPMWTGSVIGVIIVTVYCLAGGIRASIWTDVAQSIVMFGAMFLLLGTCMAEVGGPAALLTSLETIDPALADPMPKDLAGGLGLYVIGFIFGGAATVAQPHIIVRFIAIDSVDSIGRARAIYFGWFILFSVAVITVGLYARVLLPDLGTGLTGEALSAATESALPTLSMSLLPAVLVGVILAGLFAATMSTADSQLLSCSAAITQDIHPAWSKSVPAAKFATLGVGGLALAIALSATEGVFALVMIAWSTLGATLGPVLLVRLAGRPLSSRLGIAMMASGLATVIAWKFTPWADAVFELLPGIIVSVLVYVAAGRGRRNTP
ncbi:MAG: sodium/proline symporter [Proteobacteria bacterium]|nr:sodium/proline symporter [Pseudomonadota bacterium]